MSSNVISSYHTTYELLQSFPSTNNPNTFTLSSQQDLSNYVFLRRQSLNFAIRFERLSSVFSYPHSQQLFLHCLEHFFRNPEYWGRLCWEVDTISSSITIEEDALLVNVSLKHSGDFVSNTTVLGPLGYRNHTDSPDENSVFEVNKITVTVSLQAHHGSIPSKELDQQENDRTLTTDPVTSNTTAIGSPLGFESLFDEDFIPLNNNTDPEFESLSDVEFTSEPSVPLATAQEENTQPLISRVLRELEAKVLEFTVPKRLSIRNFGRNAMPAMTCPNIMFPGHHSAFSDRRTFFDRIARILHKHANDDRAQSPRPDSLPSDPASSAPASQSFADIYTSVLQKANKRLVKVLPTGSMPHLVTESETPPSRANLTVSSQNTTVSHPSSEIFSQRPRASQRQDDFDMLESDTAQVEILSSDVDTCIDYKTSASCTVPLRDTMGVIEDDSMLLDA